MIIVMAKEELRLNNKIAIPVSRGNLHMMRKSELMVVV